MGQKVTFTIDAQHAPAVDAFLKVAQAVQLTGGQGQKAGQQMQQAGGAASAAWEKGLNIISGYPAALARMVTGAAGVYAVIAQLRAELERVGELQKKAMTSIDTAQDPYYKARQSVSPEYANSKLSRVLTREGMQAYGDSEPASYLNLLASMESARGEYGQVGTHRAANVVAQARGRMNMENESATEFGGALLDAMNVQKAHGKNYTPKAVAGKFISMYGVTRSTNIHEFAKYDMRTINTMARFGFSMDQAIGFQSAIAGSKPDPTGRISATGMGLLMGDMAKAYTYAHQYGMGIKGLNPEDYEKSGMGMFDVARGDTKTGRAMQAYLFGARAGNKKVRDLAMGLPDMGPSFMGHARGESGFFELARELLNPNEQLFGRAQEASSRVVSDADAENYFDEMIKGTPGDRHEGYYANRAASRGALAVGKWENVEQAARGNVVELQSELADILGTSDIGQKIAGTLTSLRANAADPAMLGNQQREVIQGGIESVRAAAADRARIKKYGGERTAWLPDYFNPISDSESSSQMNEQERLLIQTLERLIETLANQELTVKVEDPTGRQMGRSTSRPRALETFNEDSE